MTSFQQFLINPTLCDLSLVVHAYICTKVIDAIVRLLFKYIARGLTHVTLINFNQLWVSFCRVLSWIITNQVSQYTRNHQGFTRLVLLSKSYSGPKGGAMRNKSVNNSVCIFFLFLTSHSLQDHNTRSYQSLKTKKCQTHTLHSTPIKGNA